MVKKRREAETSEDLISKLPDDVLTHILAYLPTKSSVATCVLSKRWSLLWLSVPNLDFGWCSFDSSVRRAQFENFMDRFLSLSSVRSVRMINFQLGRVSEISHLNAWLAAFGDRDAEKIDLKLPVTEYFSPIYSLPDSFFNQNNLVKLKLNAIVLKVPLFVCFSKLKDMNLHSFQLVDETSMKNLLWGSPVLSTLRMYLDKKDNVQTLHICSSSLRNLYLIVVVGNIHQSDVVINSPNLTFLSVTDFAHSTLIINAPLLSSARLCISKGEVLLKLLTQISRIKELCISHFFMGDLPDTLYANLPMLRNLIHLRLEIGMGNNSRNLSHLLLCTPNLVTLSVQKDHTDDIHDWFESYEVPPSFLSSIESVDFKWVRDGGHDLQMITYILRNARILKKLFIHCHAHFLVNETKFLTTLLTLPRSSTTCQVECKLH